MNWINLIAIPFVLLLAWAKGRGLLRWAIMAYIFGFWSFVPLLLARIKNTSTAFNFVTLNYLPSHRLPYLGSNRLSGHLPSFISTSCFKQSISTK
jgi:hypothetical protein